MNKFISTLLLLFWFFVAFSQNNNNNYALANQYYLEKEFQKASELFKELYSQTNSSYYFSYYINCLVELKKFAEAEQEIKKILKNDKKNISMYIELGYLYNLKNEEEKSIEYYETALKKIITKNDVFSTANTFISKRLYSWAEKSYLNGRKIATDDYTFNFELANIYLYLNNYENMINEYLWLIDKNPEYLESVQNRLESVIYSSKDEKLNEILRTSLLKKVQENPNNEMYQELLIWFLIQKNDFVSAFIQTKAIDKRKKEEGERLLKLAELSYLSGNYDIAINCYDYIINLGPNKIYYSYAKSKLSEILFSKITETSPSEIEIKKLETILKETIKELGKNKSTFTTLINLAKIEGFYLTKPDTAINYIENALTINNVEKQQKDLAKLVLGDIYLLKDEWWNATLIYAQVEQENKGNTIGNEAQLKKAKLAYFDGEFLWSQAQLDVLKASTSKLIANDAFQLSLVISNSLEADSTGAQLKIIARADFLTYSKNDSLALLTLDSITNNYPSSSLNETALYKKAEIYYRKGNFEKAIENLKEITEKYSFGIFNDNALYFWAEIELNNKKNKEKAMELYKEILTNNKSSYFVAEAREKYRLLRGDFQNN